MTPVAEFNVLVDAEAAKIVYDSGVEIVQIPIQVSHKVLVTSEILERISSINTKFSKLMISLLTFFAQSYKQLFKMDAPPLHDPLTVAYVINPNLFTVRKMRVDIETSSPLCYGQTVCDIYDMSNKPKNCFVAEDVNVDGFWELMIEAIILANGQSPLNLD